MEPRGLQVCNLHGDIMKCLGKLEQSSDDAKETLNKLYNRLEELVLKVELAQRANGVEKKINAVDHAKDAARANIIYWVLGVAGG